MKGWIELWVDYQDGMILDKGAWVKAVPYFDRKYIECMLIDKKGDIWIAKDMEVSRQDIDSHVGDMSIIMLEEEMIRKVFREEY